MDRSRRASPRSNVLPFRIPARTEDPKLPPASAGAVVAFKRPTTAAETFAIIANAIDEYRSATGTKPHVPALSTCYAKNIGEVVEVLANDVDDARSWAADGYFRAARG